MCVVLLDLLVGLVVQEILVHQGEQEQQDLQALQDKLVLLVLLVQLVQQALLGIQALLVHKV